MPDCPSCGAPVKDGDWTCGVCGVPVAGAAMAASAPAGEYAAPHARQDYLPEYRTQPATAAAEKQGSSGTLRLVLIVAAIAIVAVVAVWFFALRGPSTTGEEYLGSWTATTQKGIATAVITKKDDAFSVTLAGDQQSQKITVPAHLDGKDLVITIDDFSQIAGEANADRFKAALKALAGDFKLVFSAVDASDLSLRIVGKSASGQDFDQTIPLLKDATGTT